MSISVATPAGRRISTRIRQALFNPDDIEFFMYTGDRVTSLFGHEIRPAGWSQLSWNRVGAVQGESAFISQFPISGPASFGGNNSMDYILAVAYEAIFPQLTLVNTQAPIPYFIQAVAPTGVTAPVVVPPQPGTIVTGGAALYFYLSNGTMGLPTGTVYVGSLSALTGTPGLGIDPSLVLPFVSYSPRHRVGWSDYALLAAIEEVNFSIDGAVYEELNKHALFNALQYRTRQDVFPVSVEEATSFDAVLIPAGVGGSAVSFLGGPLPQDRYKGFVAPFSFTTSALADRGIQGQHTSAFPAFMACNNTISTGVSFVPDLREILLLEEEVLPNYATQPVIFVATPAELGVVGTGPTVNTIFITDGATLYSITPASFVAPIAPATAYSTSGALTVSVNGTALTYGPASPFTIQALGVLYLEQTGEYLPITRPIVYNIANPFSAPLDYSTWIVETNPQLVFDCYVLGASITDWERGASKIEGKNKQFLYERYVYEGQELFGAGGNTSVQLYPTAGQFKYAYAFAQNEISRLQGQQFNYTNSSQYEIIIDSELQRPKFIFPGSSAVTRIQDRIGGYLDGDHPVNFYRYIDNPLFAQRMPRNKGSSIVSRRANWINSIDPDGSTSAGLIDNNSISMTLAPSALLNAINSPLFGTPNSFLFNAHVISVLWDIIGFDN